MKTMAGTSDLDICRAVAKLLIDQHGHDALVHAAMMSTPK
jgi:hypothetical protein